MKRLLLILFSALSLSDFSEAQVNLHFPHHDAIWGQFEGVYIFGFNGYYSGATHYYAANGDSSLNSFMYIKIYDSDSSGNSYGYPPHLIREEGERVYYFLPFEQVDTLLYDFSLQPGDTANVYTNWIAPIIPVVDSVGVIQTGNQLRKCIYFNKISGNATFNQTNYGLVDYTPIMWIEGIGSNDGLFVPYGGAEVIDGITFLTCFRENDTVQYGDVCNLVYTPVNEASKKEGIEVFPNPANEKVFINSDSFHVNGEFIIYSSFGNEMLRKTFLSSAAFAQQVDLLNFPEGIYFLVLHSANDNYSQKLVVVKN